MEFILINFITRGSHTGISKYGLGCGSARGLVSLVGLVNSLHLLSGIKGGGILGSFHLSHHYQ